MTTYYDYQDAATGEFLNGEFLKQNRIVGEGIDGLHPTSLRHLFYATLGFGLEWSGCRPQNGCRRFAAGTFLWETGSKEFVKERLSEIV